MLGDKFIVERFDRGKRKRRHVYRLILKWNWRNYGQKGGKLTEPWFRRIGRLMMVGGHELTRI